ncbi:hypothetical protein SKAU_G00326590 [Synaphobranchus kaupii]|uniref:Myb/SANT-like DNA-binding domain-containing protein n=1 Tax=Synaphobranchus kaupii TaxID=118154 RepID=A0A9Q1EPQ3_SYNKA|nr:hypothetical protein SKAU_G00326590 [Synaphobranchus kaupii]
MSSGRKPNFSKDEVFTIIELVGQNKNIIFGKYSDIITRDAKMEKWQYIANAVNGVAGTQRSLVSIPQQSSQKRPLHSHLPPMPPRELLTVPLRVVMNQTLAKPKGKEWTPAPTSRQALELEDMQTSHRHRC